MMKHVIGSLLLSFLLLTGSAKAQGDGDQQKIETAKIGLITNRLNLTQEQAPQFWAVYNEYNGRKKELNRRLRQLNSGATRQGIAESNVMADLREINNTKQKLASLDEEYMSKFLKVISPSQLAELYKTERMFNKMLLDRLSAPNN